MSDSNAYVDGAPEEDLWAQQAGVYFCLAPPE